MAGAIGVYASVYWSSQRLRRPLLGEGFSRPPTTRVDARLVIGSVIFGLGWGLGGYCPGPAFTAGGAGLIQPLLFVAAMLAGQWLARTFAPPRPY
jgi:hypothetical protein